MKKILLIGLVFLLSLNLGIKAEQPKVSPEDTYPYPVDMENLSLLSENYVLLDVKTGDIVGGKNIDTLVHPASITKAFTILAGLEELEGTNLDDIMVISPEIFPIDKIASIARFNPDDKFSYNDVLYGIALPSGADAANALSYELTGSSEGLVEQMNDLTARIGMKNTNFVNTTGLDDDKHLTTVEDLAIGIRYALNNEDFKRFYLAKEHTSAPSRMHPEGIPFQDVTLKRAADLSYTQIIGAKSGTTELAGRSVSLLIESDGNEYIYVSTNAPLSSHHSTPINDAMKLINHLELNLQRVELYLANQPITTKSVFGLKNPLKMMFANNQLYYLDNTKDAGLIRYEFTQTPKIALRGISKGTQIAEMTVYYEDEIIHSESVFALEDYKLSGLMIFLIAAVAIIVLVGIVTLLAIIYFAIIRKRNRRRRRRTTGRM